MFVLVGLTITKLSAWLPAVALTLTTGSRQINGVNGIGRFRYTTFGFIHLRVPSGTSMPLGRRQHLGVQGGCGGHEEGENGGKRVKRRRVFIGVFLLMRREGLVKRTRKRRDC